MSVMIEELKFDPESGISNELRDEIETFTQGTRREMCSPEFNSLIEQSGADKSQAVFPVIDIESNTIKIYHGTQEEVANAFRENIKNEKGVVAADTAPPASESASQAEQKEEATAEEILAAQEELQRLEQEESRNNQGGGVIAGALYALTAAAKMPMAAAKYGSSKLREKRDSNFTEAYNLAEYHGEKVESGLDALSEKFRSEGCFDTEDKQEKKRRMDGVLQMEDAQAIKHKIEKHQKEYANHGAKVASMMNERRGREQLKEDTVPRAKRIIEKAKELPVEIDVEAIKEMVKNIVNAIKSIAKKATGSHSPSAATP